MVLDAIRRELLSMESLISVLAIGFAFTVIYASGHYETMESGFAVLFATAVYPPMYYRESGATITRVPWGVVYGLGAAAGVYLTFQLCYSVAGWLSLDGINAEAAALVLVTVIVFGLALVEKRFVDGPTMEADGDAS